MELLLIFGLWLLNAVISTINSFAVGYMFRRGVQGWDKLVAWSGYVMAGSGYSWCIIILLAFGAVALGLLNLTYVTLLLNIGYVVLIPGILLTGYIITIDSLRRAYRNRSLGSMGIAGYNVFASAHNTVNAFRILPEAMGSIIKAFSRGDSSKNALVLLLAVFAILSGFMLSGVIVWRVSQGGE